MNEWDIRTIGYHPWLWISKEKGKILTIWLSVSSTIINGFFHGAYPCSSFIHFCGSFPHKPSILGIPHWWKAPFASASPTGQWFQHVSTTLKNMKVSWVDYFHNIIKKKMFQTANPPKDDALSPASIAKPRENSKLLVLKGRQSLEQDRDKGLHWPSLPCNHWKTIWKRTILIDWYWYCHTHIYIYIYVYLYMYIYIYIIN